MSATEEAYRQLAASLRRGEFEAGQRLPGERELAPRLGVSRVTLRRALGILADEGKLERSAQRGWFVTSEIVGEAPSQLQSFTEMALARGLTPTARVLTQRVRPASIDEAEALRISPAAPVIELRRVRGMDAQPICVDLVVLPLEGLEALANRDLSDRSLYETLEQDFGVQPYRCAYSVQAEAADAEISELLHYTVGAPILLGSEVTYSADGTPLLMGTNRYRGDAYRFHADLFRSQ